MRRTVTNVVNRSVRTVSRQRASGARPFSVLAARIEPDRGGQQHLGREVVRGDNPLSSVLTLGGAILVVFAFSSLILAFDIGQGLGGSNGLLGITLFLLFLTSGGAVILVGSAQRDSVRRDRERVAFQDDEIAQLNARLAELEKKNPNS